MEKADQASDGDPPPASAQEQEDTDKNTTRSSPPSPLAADDDGDTDNNGGGGDGDNVPGSSSLADRLELGQEPPVAARTKSGGSLGLKKEQVRQWKPSAAAAQVKTGASSAVKKQQRQQQPEPPTAAQNKTGNNSSPPEQQQQPQPLEPPAAASSSSSNTTGRKQPINLPTHRNNAALGSKQQWIGRTNPVTGIREVGTAAAPSQGETPANNVSSSSPPSQKQQQQNPEKSHQGGQTENDHTMNHNDNVLGSKQEWTGRPRVAHQVAATAGVQGSDDVVNDEHDGGGEKHQQGNNLLLYPVAIEDVHADPLGSGAYAVDGIGGNPSNRTDSIALTLNHPSTDFPDPSNSQAHLANNHRQSIDPRSIRPPPPGVGVLQAEVFEEPKVDTRTVLDVKITDDEENDAGSSCFGSKWFLLGIIALVLVAIAVVVAVVLSGGGGGENSKELDDVPTASPTWAPTMERLEIWSQLGEDIDGSAINNNKGLLGHATALSADGLTVATSALGQQGGTDTDFASGYVEVRRFDSATSSWLPLGQRIMPGTDSEFGNTVALSADGETLAVGVPRGEDDGGTAIVFRYNQVTSEWAQLGRQLPSKHSGDDFGSSIALSSDGRTVAVGAMNGFLTTSDLSRGIVRVFGFSDDWDFIGEDIVGLEYLDMLGRSVALSSDGRRLAVGSVSDDSVRIFQYNQQLASWNSLSADLYIVRPFRLNGLSVAISSDGTTIASSTLGIASDESPVVNVRVFVDDEDSADWKQLGNDLSGPGAGGMFSESIALSSDGRTMVCGFDQATKARRPVIYRYDPESATWAEVSTVQNDGSAMWLPHSLAMSANGDIVAVGDPSAGRVGVFVA